MKRPKETRLKISLSVKKAWKEGRLKGHTEETKKKISLMKMGENNPMWKGGYSRTKEYIKKKTAEYYERLKKNKTRYRIFLDKQNARVKAQYKYKIKEKCKECDSENTERHHPNYKKPYEIIWLCKKCHDKLHVNLKQVI